MKTLEKVYEPDEKTVHICAYPTADCVTLCGLTDWIGHKGKPQYGTRKPLNCSPCREIWEYCNSGRLPA